MSQATGKSQTLPANTENVDNAGATMNSDTDVSGNGWVLDEDDMASDSDTKLATQQSIKKYVDDHSGGITFQKAAVLGTL